MNRKWWSNGKKMISIIVPVYNVEPYLQKCLDSIINQTYKELEIIIVDDGSTDNCGKICDKYELKDGRVKVFHTENRGLSSARNLALESANGDYIGFVDADDWIETEMYEMLLTRAEAIGADVVECGVIEEHSNGTVARGRKSLQLSGVESVGALLCEELSDNVWNKLWRKQCFSDIRFPEGRLFEDIATTYRILMKVNCVTTIESCEYHYLQRSDALSKSHSMYNLTNYWTAHLNRYKDLYTLMPDDSRLDLLKYCASAASRFWAYYCDCTVEDKNQHSETLQEINNFIVNNIPVFGFKDWQTVLRVGVFFPHFCNRVSLRIAWLLNRMRNTLKPRELKK